MDTLHRSVPRARAWRQRLAPHAWSAGVVVLCTALCAAFLRSLDRSNLIMVYLLGVTFAATRYGRGPAVTAACLSVAAFDFFFVPPHLTFAVSDTQYLVTFGVMLTVGLLISTLAERLRQQARVAQQREQRIGVLYAMSLELAGLRKIDEIARAACRHVSEVFRGSAMLLLPKTADELHVVCATGGAQIPDAGELALAEHAYRHGCTAGCIAGVPGASALYVPLNGTQQALGVLGVQPDPALERLSPDQTELLETLARQVATAIERVRLAGERQQARLAAEQERLRSILLSSVSHDFRTPLGVIAGAASGLLGQPGLPDGARRELTQTIYEESERLNRLVANLLDMTRLESAVAPLSREWHSLEEILGSANRRMERVLDGRRLQTVIPEDLPLVSVDAVLLEQVFVNLLDNAAKYTPPGAVVRIAAERYDGEIVVEVSDDGPGLPHGAEQRVFDKFVRGSDARGGFGLGLAICRAVVEAHGGRIWAESRRAVGAVFKFALPVGGVPPVPPEDGPDERPV